MSAKRGRALLWVAIGPPPGSAGLGSWWHSMSTPVFGTHDRGVVNHNTRARVIYLRSHQGLATIG